MRYFLDCMIEGLARFGCGMAGLAYPHDYEEPTLGPVDRNGQELAPGVRMNKTVPRQCTLEKVTSNNTLILIVR